MKILNTLIPVNELGFGLHFAPKMIRAHYQNEQWTPSQIVDSDDLKINAASKVLHYAQEIFEGLKAYKQKDGKIVLFRPDANIKRMSHSSELLAMPEFPEEEHLKALKEIVKQHAHLVPEAPGSLYLRPTMVSTTPTLGVVPGNDYVFFILASPVGGYFGESFADRAAQVKIQITEDHVRAAPGGVGSAKTGGNYAASLRAVMKAKKAGYANALFLDAVHKRYLEELGGMNVFVVEDGVLKTPPLSDTILAGVTRDSILKLAKHLNIPAEETPIDVEKLMEGISNGSVSEVFACGTAAVITSISHLNWKNEEIAVNNGANGVITNQLFKELVGIQTGELASPFTDWIVEV